MAESVLLGLDGNDDIWECAYVDSSVTKLPFFASKVRIQPFQHAHIKACYAVARLSLSSNVMLLLHSVEL